MLPAKNRLQERPAFDHVFSHSRPVFAGTLSLRACKNNLPETRIGFVVSKKYSPLATRRNRARRLLRVVMAENLPQLVSGFDLVVYATKKPVAPEKIAQVRLDLGLMLKKTNLFKTNP